MRKIFISWLFSLFIIGTMMQSANACTRILWADNGQAVLVGRTFDWQSDTMTHLWVFPQGLSHQSMIDSNSVKWTSKYGSVVTTGYDLVSLDGMNEKGLAGNLLWLNEADYGQRNTATPGLPLGLWLQYYLDNFTTVAEAVEDTQKHPYQLLPVYFKPGKIWIKFHLALQDATGDSAILEVVNGKMHIYHKREYTIFANSPVYSKHLESIKHHHSFGEGLSLPGSTISADRFARADYFSKLLPKPTTQAGALASLMSVLNNVAEPMTTKGPHGKLPEPTYWWTIADLTHLVYYFNYVNNPNRVWVNFSELDLKAGAPVMVLNIDRRADLAGDVSKDFEAKPMFMTLENNKM